MKPFIVYILRCADGSYYTGQTDDIETRMRQHEQGQEGYTATRKPLGLAWQGEFETREAAIAFEQRVKGWSRAKKEALMAGDWARVQELAKSRSFDPSTSSGQVRGFDKLGTGAGLRSFDELRTTRGLRSFDKLRTTRGLRQAQPERGIHLRFEVVEAADFEPLHELRMRAMRESLERVGRFDPARSRERLAAGFEPEHMRHICRGDQRIGFLTLVPEREALNLKHLYIEPDSQGQDVGAWAMEWIKSHGRDVTLSALKQSDANRFYQRHGFVQIGEEEFDIQYRWSAPT